MGKTSQRKHQAFQEGIEDGRKGLPVRYNVRHRFSEHYMNGYRKGQSFKDAKKRKPGMGIRFVFWVIKKLGVD